VRVQVGFSEGPGGVQLGFSQGPGKGPRMLEGLCFCSLWDVTYLRV
jgi:hypothetical protein